MSTLEKLSQAEQAEGAVLYEAGNHRFVWLGLVEDEGGESVQVNQYLVEHGAHAFLLDPGGVLSFPHVVATLSRFTDLEKITGLFYSHQDPDVSSGIALWMQVTPAQAYISQHWTRFVSHFGRFDSKRLEGLPDEGKRFELGGGDYLHFVPAHFLHSIGNFCVYDSRSKILFTGDIGASVFTSSQARLIESDDFESLRPHMEGFHRRYMASQRACAHWVKSLRQFDIQTIAPQHGAIMTGAAVQDFFRWFEKLECGVDVLGEIYSA